MEPEYSICDICYKEFVIDDDDPYQRVCNGCEAEAEDYREQQIDIQMEADAARFVDVEPR